MIHLDSKKGLLPTLILTLLIFLVGGSSVMASATEIHVHAKNGNATGKGSKKSPFKTLNQAVAAIAEQQHGGLTIVIHPGTYDLPSKLSLDKGNFTQQNRLIIRASILPDDPRWSPAKMPVIISSEDAGPAEGRGKALSGFSVGVSHVSFQGLRFKGNPSLGHRYYPIRRDKDTLKDLVVSQCLFEGDREKAPIQVAIIARGHSMVVEHCIFISCKNPTVYWQADGGNSYGNVFRKSIAVDSYQSGLWTTDTASDFEFSHNIFVGGNVFLMQRFARESFFNLTNSYITGFEYPTCSTTGPGGKEASNPAPITIREHRVFRLAEIRFDQDYQKGKNRSWLHVAPDSPGYELGAGLFRLANK